ncbi:L-arabinose transport system permease protein AraQ [Thermoflexales bacterium]|nr:L-arabinose transport system permease protein AraQ [Thermoflexales bacterium]
MTTTTATSPVRSRNTVNWAAKRRWRNFTAVAGVTLLGLIVLLAFLMPLGYLFLTSVKDLQQIQDPNAPFLPSRTVNYTYEGKEYPLVEVPVDGEIKQWALIKRAKVSQLLDPQNPDQGLIEWTGSDPSVAQPWRQLKPVYRTEPYLGNFAAANEAINIWRLLRNTFIIAALGTVGTVIASTFVAYGFTRFKVPGKNVIFIILMATIILPSQVTLIPTYVFFRTIGWGGTWWPLIIPHFFSNAYNVFLLRQYFMSIPKELDEAAWIDGASPFRTLVSVIIPQAWPALTAVAMFHFFFAWNDFFAPLVYLAGNEELYPIAVGLTQFNNAYGSQPGQLMAATLMAIAIPVVIFFMAQRQFMQGIVVTGVEK